jgi:hypothetical protein
MVPGLSESGATEATAYGTIGLAAVTLISLAFGWRALRQGQREVEEAHRPVLVPVDDRRTILLPGRGEKQAAPRVLDEHPAIVMIPIENVGSGAALNACGCVESDEDASSIIESKPLAAAGKGATKALWFTAATWLGTPGGSAADLTLSVRYEDVGQGRWLTTARWDASKDRFDRIRIRRLDGAGEQRGRIVNLFAR